MAGIEALYTNLNTIIKELEDDNVTVIDAETLTEKVKKKVDVYSASMDWYVRQALMRAADTQLWNNGYRSVIKGEGLFVNPKLLRKNSRKSKIFLSRLINNAKISEQQAKRVLQFLEGEVPELGLDGQLNFDMQGNVIEDVTEQELLKMLKEEASILESIETQEHIETEKDVDKEA